MVTFLSSDMEQLKAFRNGIRKFVDETIRDHADQFDREEMLPLWVREALAQKGFLGSIIPTEFGGLELDMFRYGILTEELGHACSSTRSLLTVHDMVAYALLRWGTINQKKQWLPSIANGNTIAAFALSEPDVGSDAHNVQTRAVESGSDLIINGHKKWISFAQIAELFLVFVRVDDAASALLVERNTPGLEIKPIQGILGTRASMLGEITFKDCRVPKSNLVTRPGFGFLGVATHALMLGRYSVACGCTGIAQAALEASTTYANQREQFGVRLKDHQLISRLISEMITQTKAARALWQQTAYYLQIQHEHALVETAVTKYFATKVAKLATDYAVQIHGANGLSNDYPVQRYYRDARVMEIIEGSNEIQQLIIAKNGSLASSEFV